MKIVLFCKYNSTFDVYSYSALSAFLCRRLGFYYFEIRKHFHMLTGIVMCLSCVS